MSPPVAKRLGGEELRKIIKRCSYRPGWNLEVDYDWRDGPRLRIEAVVPDSYNPESATTLGIYSWIPPFCDEAEFLSWLAWRLRQVEIHESREWFKVDGTVYDDPHGGD